MSWLVFDIETVPDVELGRRVFGLDLPLRDEPIQAAHGVQQD